LLTLLGAGGIGKTRLALELLRELRSESQWLVSFADLSSLAHPDLVPQGVALSLGVREQPGRRLVATLVEALEGSAVVLVLDNCEHVIQACAALALELLRGCPKLRIVATSRERLGVTGETAWPVPPLSIPQPHMSADQVEHTEGVELFVQRARAVYPTFELDETNLGAVSDICRRLDGIPLALELAAAHASLLSLEQIASRLDDSLGLLTRGSRAATDRQQTVRGTLDWSYRLLNAPERRLLDRLAVFAGGWTLDAAEAVARDDAPDGVAVLHALGYLADKSLVVVHCEAGRQMRYRLLETVGQYALERLTARGEKWSRQKIHANYFLALVERSQGELKGHLHMAAHERLQREHDNCRVALRWFIEAAETDAAQRLPGGLGRFWFFRGYLEEGEAWLARVLALPDADRPTAGRAWCLMGSGRLALSRGDYAAVQRAMGEARVLLHDLGDAAEEAFALFCLGFVARAGGDFVAAVTLLEQGIAVSRAAEDGAAEANCLWSLAEVALDQGNEREARRLAEAALVRAQAVGWPIGVVVSRRVLGSVHIREGRYAAADDMLRVSLADARAIGGRWWVAEILTQLAQLALAQGDLGKASGWLMESLTVARDLGDRAGIARALEGTAELAAVQRAARPALQLIGAAAALRESLRAPAPPAERNRLERRLAAVQRILGDAAANTARSEGCAMSLQQAIDLGLSYLQAVKRTRSGKKSTGLLTTRELGVCQLIAHGLTNRQIGDHLVIAEGTVERHVGNILAKLDMSRRTQIAAWAMAQGMVQHLRIEPSRGAGGITARICRITYMRIAPRRHILTSAEGLRTARIQWGATWKSPTAVSQFRRRVEANRCCLIRVMLPRS
jgi:predicted ATPase/DNA-binding CsgD family transcriptional regulator